MAERRADQLTLRELFTNAERLARELFEHLEKGVLPKIQNLDQLTKCTEDQTDESVPDVSVRRAAAELLGSDEFSQKLLEKMDEYLSAIDNAIERHINQF